MCVSILLRIKSRRAFLFPYQHFLFNVFSIWWCASLNRLGKHIYSLHRLYLSFTLWSVGVVKYHLRLWAESHLKHCLPDHFPYICLSSTGITFHWFTMIDAWNTHTVDHHPLFKMCFTSFPCFISPFSPCPSLIPAPPFSHPTSSPHGPPTPLLSGQ